MIIELPYGKGKIPVRLPDQSVVAYPHDVPEIGHLPSEMTRAILEPIGSPPLRDIASGKSDAVIIINDIFRRMF